MKKIFLLVAVAFLFSGCALIFKGDSVRVTFNSNPQGASVLIDGNSIGLTPTESLLKTNRSYNITFRLAGQQERTYILNNHVGALWIVLDVLGGLFPLIIDAATGAWYEFDDTNVNVSLTPTTMNRGPLPRWASEIIRANPERFLPVAR
jgi:PEGA domain